MGSCYITQGTQPSALWGPREVGLQGRRQAQEEGDIYIYVDIWLMCDFVQQKQTQHCKSIIFQSKKLKRQWPEFCVKFDNVLGKQKEFLKLRQTHVVIQRIEHDLLGLSKWFSGKDFMFPLQGVWVQSLVRKLRNHIPCGAAKKEKRRTWLIEDILWSIG